MKLGYQFPRLFCRGLTISFLWYKFGPLTLLTFPFHLSAMLSKIGASSHAWDNLP
jgi:hypothetical protein